MKLVSTIYIFLTNILVFHSFAERSIETGSGLPLYTKLIVLSPWYGFQANN